MFGLSLTDHLRLTFGHVVYSHRAHATTANRHSRWDRWLKAAEAVLMLTTAVASAVVAFTVNPQYRDCRGGRRCTGHGCSRPASGL